MTSRGGWRGGQGGGRGRGGNQGVTCFKCGQPGHFANVCDTGGRRERTCFKCHQTGHMADTCPNATGCRDYQRDNRGGSYQDRGRSRSGGQGTNFPHPASRFEPLPADHGQLDLSKGTALFVPRTSYIDIKNQNLVLKTIGLISNHYRIRPPTKKCTAFMYDVVITSTRDPVESGAGGSPAGKVSDLAGERMKKGKKKIPKKRNYEIMNQLVKDDSNRTRQVDKLFLNQKKKSPITPIYDGNKIMYTSASLSKDRAKRAVEVDVKESDPLILKLGKVRSDVFLVEFTLAKELDLSKLSNPDDIDSSEELQELITAFNMILRCGPASTRIAVGQHSLFPIDSISRLGQERSRDGLLGTGAFYVEGHFQSVRVAGDGINLIVNQSASAFYPNAYLIDFLQFLCPQGTTPLDILMDRRSKETSLRTLRKIVFTTKHTGTLRRFTQLHSISNVPLSDEYVEIDGKSTPLISYYKSHYGDVLKIFKIDLEKVSHYPCLVFRKINPKTHKTTYNSIPIHLLWLEANQHVRGMLTPEQSGVMIKNTAMKPVKRFGNIQVTANHIKSESERILQEFEIDLDLEPIKVAGKVLVPPTIVYKDGSTEKPRDGNWRNNKLFQPARLENWIVFNLSKRNDILQQFLKELIAKAKFLGLSASDPITIMPTNGNGVNQMVIDAHKLFNNHEKKHKISGVNRLILFFGPKQDEIYAQVKWFGECKSKDIQTGLVTQGIDMYKVLDKIKNLNQYLANVILKINVKLGGMNHIIDPRDTPACLKNDRVMIIGADVTHAARESGPAHKHVPYSIASLCGSYDSNYMKYYTVTSIQQKPESEREKKEKGSQEMITCIDVMFTAVLKKFCELNGGNLPNRIIYYRDGVSDGQFQTVLNEEVTRIESVFDRVPPKFRPYSPTLTLAVVSKRHQTRFMPQNPGDGVGNSGNIPAGTLVETSVTSAYEAEYFMASQGGNLGTTKASRYFFLRDDPTDPKDDGTRLSSDERVQLTYFLTHTYVKCTKSISIPAPVQYAHLAAKRARDHLKAVNFSQLDIEPDSDSEFFEKKIDDARKERIKQMNLAITVFDDLRSRFYYC